MKWIKENPKKSALIGVGIALVGGVYFVGGIGPAVNLLSALLSLI